jgi:hypothetical protein
MFQRNQRRYHVKKLTIKMMLITFEKIGYDPQIFLSERKKMKSVFNVEVVKSKVFASFGNRMV